MNDDALDMAQSELRSLVTKAARGAGARGLMVIPRVLSRGTSPQAQRAHFVFKQFAQGFDQFQFHEFGQAADIVVAFDRDGRAAGEGHGFNDVGIECALREEIGAFDLLRQTFEHVDEFGADEFTLHLGVTDALEAVEEYVARVFVDERDVVMAAEHADDLLGFIAAHEAGVDIDAR